MSKCEDLTIKCKYIGEIDITIDKYLEVSLEDIDLSFLANISEDKIISYTDVNKLLDSIDDECIFNYLEASGIIFNKG